MSDPQNAVDEILAGLPVDDLARRLGSDPASVEAAATAALPALLGGLHANAQDAAGASSIAEALGQHIADVDPASVDVADGARIAGHIFGDRQDQVVNQLGGVDGVSGDLVKKLIPVLAPIVLAYLAKQVGGAAGGSGGSGGNVVGSLLQEILKGASQGSGPSSGKGAGTIIGDLLGGLLGGGRR